MPAIPARTSISMLASSSTLADDPRAMDAQVLISTGVLLVPGLWYGSGMVARWMADRRISRATRGQGILALTYDDGPGPNTTPAILDLLARYDAKATFFMIGRSAEACPDLTRRVAEAGHTIGWHSHTHRNQWKTDPIRGVADVLTPPAILRDGVAKARVFRPPYGKMTFGTTLACALRRLPIITWTHASGDTYGTLPDPTCVVDLVKNAGGGMVLMHDMDRDDPDRSRWVLEVTERLLQLARSSDWEIRGAADE